MNRSTAALFSLAFAVTLVMVAIPAAAAHVPNSCLVKMAGDKPDNPTEQCSAVCKNEYGKWTNLWAAVEANKPLCVCGTGAKYFEAGPIGNNEQAKKVCPGACGAERGLEWTLGSEARLFVLQLLRAAEVAPGHSKGEGRQGPAVPLSGSRGW
jgi:hypothetical protein